MTAQKRAEDLQSVPVSVQALPCSELSVRNLFDRRGDENRLLNCNLASCNQLCVAPIQPRTLGMTFRQSF